MESSNLQSLVAELLKPLKDNPEALLMKVLGPANYYKAMGVLHSPIAKAFIPKGFDPGVLIGGVIDKLDDLPAEFWADLEEMLLGVLQGDAEQTAKAKKLLGGVMDGN